MNGKLDDGFLRRNVHLGSTNAVGVRVLGMRYLKERLCRKQEQDCAAVQEANQKKEFVEGCVVVLQRLHSAVPRFVI